MSPPTWAAMPSTSTSSRTAPVRGEQHCKEQTEQGAAGHVVSTTGSNRGAYIAIPGRRTTQGVRLSRATLPAGGASGGASKPSRQKARWLERAVAAAILLLPVAGVGLRCGLSSKVPFLWQRAEAPWIMAPLPVSAQLQQWGEVEPPVTSFSAASRSRKHRPRRSCGCARSGAMRVWLNGRELPEPRRDGSRGREEVVLDAAPWLVPGENELRVDVANARGPALLSVRGEGLEERLSSGPAWSVRVDQHVYAGAIVADDTRPNPARSGSRRRARR